MNNDQEQNIVKFFTQCPNIILYWLPDIAIRDKWALLVLVSICRKQCKGNTNLKELEGPYKLSLREIAALTGIQHSALRKTAGKNPREGVLDRLQALGYITLLEGRPINEITRKEGKPQTYLYIHLEKLWCDNLTFSESWRMPSNKLVDADTFTTMAGSTVHPVTNTVHHTDSDAHSVINIVHRTDNDVHSVTNTVPRANNNVHPVTNTVHRVNNAVNSASNDVHFVTNAANSDVHPVNSTGHVVNHTVDSTGHVVNHTADSHGHVVNHTGHHADSNGHVVNHTVDSTGHVVNHTGHHADSTGHVVNHTVDSTGHVVNHTVHYADSNGHVVNHTVHDGSTKSALIHNYTDNTIKDESNIYNTIKDNNNIYNTIKDKSNIYNTIKDKSNINNTVKDKSNTNLNDQQQTQLSLSPTQSQQQLESKGPRSQNRPCRASASRDIVLTRLGEHILDLYDGFKGRKAIRNEATLLAANRLGEVVGSDEDFLAVLNAIVNDPFLKHKQVRTDLDFVYRKYDGFLDIVEQARGRQLPGASGGKTDYNAVMGMTDEQRAAYKRAQQEKLKQALPPGIDRQALMNMTPEERIVVLKKLSEQQSVTAM